MWKITSSFGATESFRQSAHTGVDLAMPKGEKLYAVKDGIIKLADYGNENAGKTILLEMKDGQTAIFGHLSQFNVADGQTVKAGDLIAWTGNTGFSTGEHLHIGLKQNGNYIDPSYIVDLVQTNGQCALQKTLTLNEFLKGATPDLGTIIKSIPANLIDLLLYTKTFLVNNPFLGELSQQFVQLFS